VYLLCPSHLDGPLIRDLPLLLHLALVTDHINAHVLSRMLLYLAQPLRQVCKGIFTCHVIGKEHAVGASIENTSHTLEGLLPGSVPNLQLYHFVLYFDSKGAEFDSYRHLMLRLELIVHHSLH